MEPAKTTEKAGAHKNAMPKDHFNNQQIVTGGNQRSSEDDLDLDKQPYHTGKFRDEEFNAEDLEQETDELPEKRSTNFQGKDK